MTHIWAIADLHLSFGTPDKSMDRFGPHWVKHHETIKRHWLEKVSPEDIVLIAGDISWAKKWKEAVPDLEWIAQLPGEKVLIKGNHDYWWPSLKKLQEQLPKSIHAIHNNAISLKGVALGGTRLWDSDEYGFLPYIDIQGEGKTLQKELTEEDKKRFDRELQRLEQSLQQIDSQAPLKIAMTHYPPISAELSPSKSSAILESYGINHCLFGHLHSVRPNSLPFGEAKGVHYHLTSCDYLDFDLKWIAKLD